MSAVDRPRRLELRTDFRGEPWTRGEDMYIRSRYGEGRETVEGMEGADRVAAVLGRSKAEVVDRAYYLKKKHGKEWRRI